MLDNNLLNSQTNLFLENYLYHIVKSVNNKVQVKLIFLVLILKNMKSVIFNNF